MKTNDQNEVALDSHASPTGASAPLKCFYGGLDSIDVLGLEEEVEYIAKLDADARKIHTLHVLSQFEDELRARHGTDDSFTSWKSSRRLDPTDFCYFFYHRRRLDAERRQLLEVVASKIRHVRRGGDRGYFNQLNEKFDYARSLAVLIMSGSKHARKLAFCGIKAGGSNPGRCKLTDFCPLCLWLDAKRLSVESFGRRSSAFTGAEAWYFITCGFSSEKANSHSVGLAEAHDQPVRMHRSGAYDAFPVQLGDSGPDGGVDAIGCDDAQMLGYAVQKSLETLRKAGFVNGYRSKLEGAFRLRADTPTRVNLHGHCIANSDVESAQSIADQLFESMFNNLKQFKGELDGIYYPDVLVQRLQCRDDLHRCLVYQEKTMPVAAMISSSLDAARSSSEDNEVSAQTVESLLTNLCRLADENLPHIFDTVILGEMLSARLYRRKSVGNMVCSDKREFIGDEPQWHIAERRKRSARQKEQREKKRLYEEYQEPSFKPVKQKMRTCR